MLVGRRVECALIEDLLEGARRGRSGSLVLAGAAGIGKSALIGFAADEAGAALVLSVRGVEAETRMPFAGLHGLLRPVSDRLELLAPPQRHALRTALGLEAGAVPSRFLVSAATVELLAGLAEERPTVCLVDDAQWLDNQTLTTLTFAERRLRGDRWAMIVAVREGETGPADVDRLLGGMLTHHLAPLDDIAADQLLATRSDLDEGGRLVIKRTAQGNPLALRELSPDPQIGAMEVPLSLPEHLERDYRNRFAGCTEAGRKVLLLAAADDTGELAVLLGAASRCGVPTDQLEEVERLGLVRTTGTRFEFRHPLVRSAVYHSATAADRRTAHLVLAQQLAETEPGRATWHRAFGAVAPAEGIADELADVASLAIRRAATDAASEAFARAAGLTSDPSRRQNWLLDAAEAAWDSGQLEKARQLIGLARTITDARSAAGRVDHLRGRFEASTGSAVQGFEILLAGAQVVGETAPRRAGSMLFDALRAASVAGDLTRVARVGGAADQLVAGSDQSVSSAVITKGIASLLTGDGPGAVASLRACVDTLVDSSDLELLTAAASASAFAGDYGRAHQLASEVAARCRETGALAVLALALEVLTVTLMGESPRQAEASADEGLRVARETDQSSSMAIHLSTLATVSALRGDRASTEEFSRQVLELDRIHGLGYPVARALAARGLLELGLGRPEEAMVHYQTVAPSGGGHAAVRLGAVDFAVLAALGAGSLEEARGMIATARSWRWVQEANEDWRDSTLDRWDAMVASGDEATCLFERSLARQSGSRWVIPFALTHLLLGEHLRRSRQRAAARPHLRVAADVFGRLGASPWADRAYNELRATGETSRRRDSEVNRLTPQELQVARLVATGASTKRVASQLYLSPRTVDYHLRKVFIKLDISSRTDLRNFDLS